MLRATKACNLSPLIWPAGSAPAALASLLFDPPELQIIEKTQCFASFLPFRTWIFFLRRLSLFDLLCSSLLFSNSSHLSFSSVHIVGSLTSKLPSTNHYKLRFGRLLKPIFYASEFHPRPAAIQNPCRLIRFKHGRNVGFLLEINSLNCGQTRSQNCVVTTAECA